VAPGWQPLPVRAARLAAFSGLLTAAVVPGLPAAVLWWALEWPGSVYVAAVLPVLCGLLGTRIGWRRASRTRWQLDETGVGLQRSLWWEQQTHVPLSRVQHLDLRRGPLQRRAGLSTLVVHTAGSRHSAVVLSGLDVDDAEHLRDTLARQLDQDADAL